MVRLKHRYILFTTSTTSNSSTSATASAGISDGRAILALVRDVLETSFGTFASGRLAASLHVKYYSPATGRGILQADRAHYRLAWAALSLALHTHSHTVTHTKPGSGDGSVGTAGGAGTNTGARAKDGVTSFRVLGVSGTMRKAEERLVRRDQLEVFLCDDR